MASLSYQLYSSRNFDMGEILATLEQHGVTEVEGYGPLFDDPAATQAKLAAHGLSMPTAHMSLDLVEGDPERTLAIAKALNIQAVIVPHIMPDLRPTTAEGWAAFGKRLAAAGKPIVDAGLKFGWHNHDFEFKACEDGSFPIEHIANGADYINLELDLAWVHVGGQDPIAWLEKFGDRVIAVHVKDRAATGEKRGRRRMGRRGPRCYGLDGHRRQITVNGVWRVLCWNMTIHPTKSVSQPVPSQPPKRSKGSIMTKMGIGIIGCGNIQRLFDLGPPCSKRLKCAPSRTSTPMRPKHRPKNSAYVRKRLTVCWRRMTSIWWST